MERTQFDTLCPQVHTAVSKIEVQYGIWDLPSSSGAHRKKTDKMLVIVEVCYLKQGCDTLAYLLKLYVGKCSTLIIPVLKN